VGEIPAASGWLATVILGGVYLVTKILERRTARQADKERGPVEGFTALATAQTQWQEQLLERQGQLLEQLADYRAETKALRAELSVAREEITALREQIRESG